MLLHHMSSNEVAAFLRTSDTIVIPIGSTEQHGPTGLLGTDALCPEGIAWA
ncbi:MAG: creatininase family protein, partial [Myxococcota bacterium]